MSTPQQSIFHNALQVSPERIAAMSDGDLQTFMGQLLRAQACLCRSPLSKIEVNTEGNAKDGGSDGWSDTPAIPDEWLGSTETCWQFKAGKAGQPAKLADAVTKPIPRMTLEAGGRFVVVTSASTSGAQGERDRLEKLTAAAKEAGIPSEKIEVFGSERLAAWCNQHPARAAYWAGRPDGLWTLDQWLDSDEHRVPWQASVPVQSDLAARRADLDFAAGTVQHLHIYGPPGVGKTRFALELCRGAEWRSAVIYIRQASDFRLPELIDSAAAEASVRLVVVADEVQAEDLRPLRDSIGRGNGRIRLITVGHSPTPDGRRILPLMVKPLERQVLGDVVRGWYPAMPQEHVDFVVRFADGYVRLARLAADAVVRSPTMNMRRLLSQDDIRGFLDGMLGTGNRRALYVVAVLTTIGWTGDKQGEGEAVARHLGMDWNRVRASVDDFDRCLHIVPRGGRYRYISPTPLGIHLAAEAWTTYPDLLKTLPGALPTEESRDAYYERLQSMASHLHAQESARGELSLFRHIDDFVEAHAVRRWTALSAADPGEAARQMLLVLTRSGVEERRRIEERARRETVWTLVGLAWKASSFHDAVMSLALLAEAENETWANNASHEFIARFQILLGGTAAPYLDRLSVIDELLAGGRPTMVRLAVQALAQAGREQVSRECCDPASDELPEREWRPSTREEHLECIEAAIARLVGIARRGTAGIQADLVAAAEGLSWMLREPEVRQQAVSVFEAVREAYPEARESLRRTIARIIHRERKYSKGLSTEDMKELETLHGRFEDHEIGARLRQHVGVAPWDRDEQPDLRPLAEEILSDPETLEQQWPWLTSGEAHDAWRLGEALAAADSEGTLVGTMPLLPGGGRDLRLLCGYVNARRQTLGDGWYEEWVKSQFGRDPRPCALLFEVAWRCGSTEVVADMVIEMIRSGQVSRQVVGLLGFGRWGEDLSSGTLEKVLRAMAETGNRETAIAILHNRMESYSVEAERWKALALELVTASDLIRSGDMTSYHWKEVASTLVGDHSRDIAAAILREQATRKPEAWFIEHSDAREVLDACVKQDPMAVWEATHPYLASLPTACMFSIGFPRGVLERMPRENVRAWIAEKPDERARVVARLASDDMSTDETLSSMVLAEYGDRPQVASAFFSAYVSGTWWGPASSHWDELAAKLEAVASRTRLPRLRSWASDSARSLREMSERDRRREEEERLGRT